MAFLSIIIPVYNSGRSIIRCLKSIEKQTYTDFELLVIDDGSRDGSYDTAKRYIDKSGLLKDRTTLLRKENTGAADTRNFGIGKASGTYVAFIDQDDFIGRGYLEAYVKAAKKTSADIVVGGYERVASDGRIIRRERLSESAWAKYIVTAPWAHVYRKSFLEKNDIGFLKTGLGEDVYFNMVAYQYTDKIKVIDNEDYKWFFNENSVSNSKQNTINIDMNPCELLSAIYDRVSSIDTIESEFFEYYIMRYICWYFLFSVRGSRIECITAMYNAVFTGLKARFPSYRHNRYVGLKMPKGENVKYHAFVVGFYFLERIRLLKPILKMFGV